MFKGKEDPWIIVQVLLQLCRQSDVLEELYISLVRPHLEYGCVIWDVAAYCALSHFQTTYRHCLSRESHLLINCDVMGTKLKGDF